jgi:uncharacterized phiE125 gp8 family phage protein
MRCQLITAPASEPISLSELSDQLKIDPDTFAENLTAYTSTVSGSHAVNTGYTLYGTAVDVSGKKAVVYLRPVNNGTAATVDCKIQESDDNVTWTDWTGGAFTQVTEANDTVIQEKEYTGIMKYIRTASKVLVLASEFGTDVIVQETAAVETTLLTAIIKASRQHVEDITRRALITQVWDYYLDNWPNGNFIKIPFGNLQSVPANQSVKWKDDDGTETTLTLTTDYLWETNGEACGRIVLPYAVTWPSETLYPSNPITIRFVCGWTSASAVPEPIRVAVKMITADLYQNRGDRIIGQSMIENKTANALLASYRLWEEF